MPPVEFIGKLLLTPLTLSQEDEPQTLLELEEPYTNALYDWALCRRQIVQNRLVPTTLLLAFLGVLANTSLGESAIQAVTNVVRDFFQPSTGLNRFIVYWKLVLLMAVIVVPVVFIVLLLNEAFVMDYIAQACVLARHAKLSSQQTTIQDEDSASHPAKKSPRLLRWLRRWFT